VGIDEFILSGHPHLEEAYWFGEGVLPLLAAKGLWHQPTSAEVAGLGRDSHVEGVQAVRGEADHAVG
ncbi:MAG TPA: hypothetical protein VHV74_06985, partial [Pseudonocardiaceae bacterium]|nr:hypothetical protein [Pseudonocardiaceae bacterium]